MLSLAGKTIEILCVVTKKMVLGVDIIVGTDVLKYFFSAGSWLVTTQLLDGCGLHQVL